MSPLWKTPFKIRSNPTARRRPQGSHIWTDADHFSIFDFRLMIFDWKAETRRIPTRPNRKSKIASCVYPRPANEAFL